jgi:hypothetical protein
VEIGIHEKLETFGAELVQEKAVALSDAERHQTVERVFVADVQLPSCEPIQTRVRRRLDSVLLAEERR